MADWITSFIENQGYLGLVLLMFLENVFPPVPSEVIMPFAGAAAAGGELNIALAVLAGTAGSVGGALLWYAIGARMGLPRFRAWVGRHGHWLTMSPEELDRASRWFKRHEAFAVSTGRLVPGLRTLVSVPAGIAGMRFVPFLAWSALGSLAWCGALAGAGFLLGSHESASRWLEWAANGIVGVLVALYLWRLFFKASPRVR